MKGAKYGNLYPPLAERVFEEERDKKDPVKAAKTRLHQIYGAYMQGNSHKKAAAFLEAAEFEAIKSGEAESKASGLNANESELIQKIDTRVNFFAEKILSLHASTKERLPYYREFYAFAAEHTMGASREKIKKISDLGCGFNPFSIPLMPPEFSNIEAYHALDIDLRTAEILNAFFEKIGLPRAALCADLAVEAPNKAVDIAFMLKLLPVLETQSSGRGFALANALNARFLIISYPAKSLGGREKGMAKNYATAFENACQSGLLCNFKQIANALIGNELVYILKDCAHTRGKITF